MTSAPASSADFPPDPAPRRGRARDLAAGGLPAWATGVMPWCGQSLDEARGIVFIATKTAEPDFYGGKRHGMNLFANSVVALKAATGERPGISRSSTTTCSTRTCPARRSS
ncbi:MAG: hypothetical protein R3F11_07740 [Verrucomicrobiales bacterium]